MKYWKFHFHEVIKLQDRPQLMFVGADGLSIIRNPSRRVRQAGGAGCAAWGAKGHGVTRPNHLTPAAIGDCRCCNHAQPLRSVLCITPRLAFGRFITRSSCTCAPGRAWKLLLRSLRFTVSKITSTHCWCVTTWTSWWQGQAGALAGGQQLLGSGTPPPVPVLIGHLFPFDAP